MNELSILQFLRKQYMDNEYREALYGKNVEKGFALFLAEQREYSLPLGDYLESFRGQSISLRHLTLLMKEVIARKFRIDFTLYSMQKHFQVSLPAIEGINTNEYWQEKLS